jgi:hypothetical protein
MLANYNIESGNILHHFDKYRSFLTFEMGILLTLHKK